MDPLSEDYREHVLAIYRRLTHTDYHASNELTSTKQSAEAFQLGYAWVSKNCGVAASELAKTVQALNVLAKLPGPICSVVEFGSGWGNLALSLAKLGLELGFDQDFFIALLLRHGFFARRVEAIPGFVGEGWMATRSRSGMAFAECERPAGCALSFWERASEVAHGRFLRASSQLPPLPPGGQYRLTVKNFCLQPLRVQLSGDEDHDVTLTIPPEALRDIDAPISHQHPLRLRCERVVPDLLIRNGDPREIGVALIRLATL
jgi:hypothetical protein